MKIPPTVGIPLDPFGPGKSDSIERQSMMIALRIKNLIEGKPIKVISSGGNWIELPARKSCRTQ